MSVKFSQFNNEPLLLNTDKVVGLHGVVNAQFPIIGIGDSFAKKIITWTQAPGSNANWIDFLNANTGAVPLISAQGTDADVNLALGAKGLGHVFIEGTGAVGVPFGTAVQQPIGFLGGLRYNTDTNFLEYWDAAILAWVDVISGAALADASYITQTDETTQLPNSQPLSAQPSGFLSSLTGTGVITNRLMATADVGRITIANPDGVLGNPTWDLATTGVTPGSYTNAALTVDAYGRLTAVATGSVGVLSVTGEVNQINSTGGANPHLTLSSTMLAPGTVAITSLTANTAVISGAGKILTSVPLADGQILIGSSTGAPAAAALNAGTGISIVPGANSITINAAATGTGSALTRNITQIAHGFTVQQLVYLNGTAYTLALANNVVTDEIVGMVTAVIDANNFTLTTYGFIPGLSGLTAGTVYWSSDVTPGLLIATAPTAIGSVQKPVFIADTTTSGYFINYRGDIITPSATGRLLNIRTFLTGTAATYAPTTGTNTAYIRMIGGGGGGGSATSSGGTQISIGGGGGGAGYLEHLLTGVVGPYIYTIGQGGAGSAAGGSTTFSGGALTAAGGNPGANGTGSTTVAISVGGSGSGATGGNIMNQAGGPGTSGVANFLNGVYAAGFGGNSALGGGAPLGTANPSVGASANANTGAGGSGAQTFGNAGTFAGGTGGSGIIIIEEYS